jgi:hypothetical protein
MASTLGNLRIAFMLGGLLASLPAPLSAQFPLVEAPAIGLDGSLLAEQAGDVGPLDLTRRLEQLEANQRLLQAMLDQSTQDTLGVQSAPGDAALERGYEIPSYVYSPSYYNRIGPGARPLADYAPPGYEARDQQEGPASPEYQRLFPPSRVSPEARDDFVTRGLYPGSFLVPGTGTSVRLRGFVRLAGLYDFDPIGFPDAFVTNSIPVPQQVGENFNVSGRISRFSLQTWTPTSFSDWNVHTFIEGDFFNGPGQAAGGGGNPFRLRHAFIDFGYFRFGQQNTVFMDAASWPSLVDFQGPNSWTNQRQPSLRMTIPIGGRMYWATSVERPFSDITALDASGNPLGTNVQNVPDFATHWRFQGDRGHLQVAGLLRTIGFRPNGGSVERLTAAGISGSSVLHPWAILFDTDPLEPEASAWTRSRLIMQGTWGPGVGRYINDLAGQRLDAQVDPVTGEFNLVDATGWNVSYEQWFTERWLSNVTYAHVDLDNNRNLPATTYDSTRYLAASLWWIPVPGLSLGMEFMTGERKNLDAQVGRVDRLHGLVQYNF